MGGGLRMRLPDIAKPAPRRPPSAAADPAREGGEGERPARRKGGEGAGKGGGGRRGRAPRAPLYEAPSTAQRYRRIEDLAAFLAGVPRGSFVDPLERPPARASRAGAQQKIAAGPGAERRLFGRWLEDETVEDEREEILLRRVRVARRRFQEIAGRVKPYALGCAYRHKVQNMPYSLTGDPMANYVMRMQTQRPTKGLYSFH